MQHRQNRQWLTLPPAALAGLSGLSYVWATVGDLANQRIVKFDLLLGRELYILSRSLEGVVNSKSL